MGTSHRDMPLAADDSLEGEGGVDEGTSRLDMPLALANDDSLEGEGGVDDVDGGEWMGSIDLMEEVDNEDEEEEEGGGGTFCFVLISTSFFFYHFMPISAIYAYQCNLCFSAQVQK